MRNSVVFVFFCVCFLFSAYSQSEKDTVKRHHLQEVNINAAADQKVFEGPAAVQVLNTQKIKQLPVMQLSDALKYMSGVVIRDYGGTGGMKTISVRGLGTQHTGVAYDDIDITDCQTGQIDLGKLSLENVSSLSLIIGADDKIFVPARLFSYSSLLKINTINAIPESNFGFRVGATAGMYGYYSGQAAIFNKIVSKKRPERLFFWNLSADYTRSKGNYPYILRYGGTNDSISHETRNNSAIQTYNVEMNAVWQLDRTQRLSAKIYYYDSDRELPPATIFYSNISRQELWNKNAFAQIHYHKYFNNKWAYQANAKYNYDFTRYLDPDYLNENGFLENVYHQQESYFSNTALYTPISNQEAEQGLKLLQFAVAQDLFYQQLNANSLDFAKPGRLTSLTSVATVIAGKKWKLNGNILFTFVNNIVDGSQEIADYYHFSPTIGGSYNFNKTFSIRVFYKNIFRMPTFNDLYYREVGNINLNPEKTHQWNAGVVMNDAFVAAGKVSTSATFDAYFNIVKDKIVAFPSHNLFSWTMLNYGRVLIAGFELNNMWNYRVSKRHNIQMNGNITYQKAVDRTDRESKTFNHQIPYTPLLSGSFSICWKNPWLDITYAFIACGKRYALSQNIPSNEVRRYFDHSISLGREFDFKKSSISVKVEFLNISNNYYEIIRNYPMQGFGFRAKVAYNFKG